MKQMAIKKTALAIALVMGGLVAQSTTYGQSAGSGVSTEFSSALAAFDGWTESLASVKNADDAIKVLAAWFDEASEEVAKLTDDLRGLDPTSDKAKEIQAKIAELLDSAGYIAKNLHASEGFKTFMAWVSSVGDAAISSDFAAAVKELAEAHDTSDAARKISAIVAVRDKAAAFVPEVAVASVVSYAMGTVSGWRPGAVAKGTASAALDEERIKAEKAAAKLRDDARAKVKAEETKKMEANFYERTLARTDVDIFFLADNTGSMGGVINSVRNNAQAILDGLRTDIENDPRFATGSKKVNARFAVGRYLGDPSERGETATSAYQLIQAMTDSDAAVKSAIGKWYAEGGGDWQEGNFYGIQQAIMDGKAMPRKPGVGTEQVTGWREGAAKVIVVFGDAPSWQQTVSERDLKELVRATGAKIIFIDTQSLNGGNGNPKNYSYHNIDQVKDAAVEIADASGGVYMRLSDLGKMKEAVVDSVFDALADNPWVGGMVVQTARGDTWRVRAPSSVTAESADKGKTLNISLRIPNQPTATFTVDTSAAGTAEKGYYVGAITDAVDVFGHNMADSVFHVNGKKDFFRFILSNGGNGAVEGYYGERLNSAAKLPGRAGNIVSRYDMRHRVVSPSTDLSSVSDAMKLFINWRTDEVYGIETNAQLDGGAGTALFVGKVNRDTKEVVGRYAYKTRQSGPNGLLIRDAARDTTTLQLYGTDGPNGMGGTFGAVFTHTGNPSLSSMMMTGYLDQASVTTAYAPKQDEVWQGYASAWVRNGSSVVQASNSNPGDVQITFRPDSAGVKAAVSVKERGTATALGFASDWDEANGSNAYLNKDAFVAVKDMEDRPSYVASAGDDSYDYQTWGVWSVESVHTGGATVLDGSHWIAGTMTPDVDMPRVGTATYNGHVHGTAYEGGALHALDGTSKLTANFGAGHISGALNINYVNGGAYATSELRGVSISGHQFAGSLGGSDNTGNIQGAFFGPGAQEVGGNWSIDKNGGASQATGIFAGKK